MNFIFKEDVILDFVDIIKPALSSQQISNAVLKHKNSRNL